MKPWKCPMGHGLLHWHFGELRLKTEEGEIYLEDAPYWYCPQCSYALSDEDCFQRSRASYQKYLDNHYWELLRQQGFRSSDLAQLRMLFLKASKVIDPVALGKWLSRPLPKKEKKSTTTD